MQLRWLFELLQVDEIVARLLRREVVEQPQHPREQESVLAAAQLLGHDDADTMKLLARLHAEERNRGC